METNRNYLLVGAFTIAVTAGIVIFVLWLAGTGEKRNYDRYIIYFKESVNGLSVDGAVKFRGIQVGNVEKMEIDHENPDRVKVTISVAADTPIKQDTVATLKFQGFTGVAFIELIGGNKNAPPLVVQEPEEYSVIPATESQLSKVFTSAPEMIDKFRLLADRANQILSDENIAKVSESIENVRTLTTTLNGGKIGESLAQMSVTMNNLAAATQRINTITQNSQGDIAEILSQTREAATHTAELTAQLEKFSKDGSQEILQLVNELKQTSRSIDELAKNLRANPAQILLPTQREGYRIP